MVTSGGGGLGVVRVRCWVLFLACCQVHLVFVVSLVPVVRQGLSGRRRSVMGSGIGFESAVNDALRSKGRSEKLRALLAKNVEWYNPVGDGTDAEKALALVAEAANFFVEPRFDVLRRTELTAKTTRYDWVASGEWPVRWAPRVIVHGSSRVTVDGDGKVGYVEDEWDAGPGAIVREQVVPRFWDVYDLWATPVAERPNDIELRKVKLSDSGATARLVRTPPRLAVRCTVLDVSNSRKKRVASALPTFAFGKDTLDATRGASTTAPVEISVEALPFLASESTDKTQRRVTWTLPLPSALGFDPDSPLLPPLDQSLDDATLLSGVAEQPTLDYVLEPQKHFLVATFAGDVQDPEADKIRRDLVASAKANGLAPLPGNEGGQTTAVIRKWRSKLGFAPDGRSVYAVYSNPPSFLPFDPDEIAIQVEAPKADPPKPSKFDVFNWS